MHLSYHALQIKMPFCLHRGIIVLVCLRLSLYHNTVFPVVHCLSAKASNTMTYDIFGAKGVNIEIPKDVFPTPEEIKLLEERVPGGEHGWFESSFEKKKLHFVRFLPKGPVKGVMVYCHGVSTSCLKAAVVGEKKLSGALLTKSFNEQGVAFYAFDYLGHGFSEGTRFFIPDWEVNKQDIITFCCDVAAKNHPTVPLFVGGESYGGCLSVHVARHFQDNPDQAPANFNAIFLTAPAILGDLPPFPVYQILRYALAPLFPKWTPFFMPNPISPDRIWRYEEVLAERTSERYREMGIDGGGLPFRLGTALNLVLALEAVRAKAIPGLTVPFVSVHGTADYGVPIEGSQILYDKSATPSDDKEFHPIEGAYHDIFADPAAEVAMEKWMNFLKKRLAATK